MAYPQTSFESLLDGLARMAGLKPSDLQADERDELLSYLQEAIDWAWRNFRPTQAHPATVESGTVTVTNGYLNTGSPTPAGAGWWFGPPDTATGRVPVYYNGTLMGYTQYFAE